MRRLDDRQHTIAVHILGNIDDDGYLRNRASRNGRRFSIRTKHCYHRKRIRRATPHHSAVFYGVGARDLRECLLLQLKRREHSITNHTAIVIIDKMMDEFIKKHYDNISKELELEPEDLKDAIGEILKLNPRRVTPWPIT